MHQAHGLVAYLAGDLRITGAVAASFGDVERPEAVRGDVRQFERGAGADDGMAQSAGIHGLNAVGAGEKIGMARESRFVPVAEGAEHFREVRTNLRPRVDAKLGAASQEQEFIFDKAGVIFAPGIEAQAEEFRGAAAGELREQGLPAKDFAADRFQKVFAKLVDDIGAGRGDGAAVADILFPAVARPAAGDVVDFKLATRHAVVEDVAQGAEVFIHGAIPTETGMPLAPLMVAGQIRKANACCGDAAKEGDEPCNTGLFGLGEQFFPRL